MFEQYLAEARIAEQRLLFAELQSRPIVEFPARHRIRRRWIRGAAVEKQPRLRPVIRIG